MREVKRLTADGIAVDARVVGLATGETAGGQAGLADWSLEPKP